MADTLALHVDGKVFRGWTAARVSRSIEALAGTFTLESEASGAPELRPGTFVGLHLGDEKVLHGYIDRVEERIDGSAHRLILQGRDATADLVDCSAMNEPGEWSKLTLRQIAQVLAQPFGILVTSLVDTGARFPRFALQPGESPREAIERACRMRGVLASTDGAGRLVLSRPPSGDAEGQVVGGPGGNVLSATVRADASERYRRYVVRGQRPGSDEVHGAATVDISGEATDPGAREGRELLVIAEASVSPEDASKRAQWDATVRAARAETLGVTVKGWRQVAGGRLWTPGELVPCRYDTLGIKGTRLVVGVELTLSPDTGRTTALSLTRSDAYLPAPTVAESP